MIIEDSFIKAAAAQILRSDDLGTLPHDINDICVAIVQASLVLEHRKSNQECYKSIESATNNGELERAILNKNIAKSLLETSKKALNKSINAIITKERKFINYE